MSSKSKSTREDSGLSFGAVRSLNQLARKLQRLPLTKAAQEVVEEELQLLELMTPGSPEFLVAQHYLSCISQLPWKDNLPKLQSLVEVNKHLDRHHCQMEAAKEAIVEFAAVALQQAKKRHPGYSLLLCGPPGVGKTSLASMIAKALGRPFVKIALGGLGDEAELRGHRRTYVSAMPGKIMEAMRQAKSQYPVILLDELDKVTSKDRGGVYGALLEALDPQQQGQYVDHFFNMPFDISKVVFVATANDVDQIPQALIERFETIHLDGYSDQEKLTIAKKHLIPRVRKELGLKASQFTLTNHQLLRLMRNHTDESGVRQLARLLQRLGRKTLVHQMRSGKPTAGIDIERFEAELGPSQATDYGPLNHLAAGISLGLAYMETGGDILMVETALVSNPHIGGSTGFLPLHLTGKLGDVLKESAQTALSYILALGNNQAGRRLSRSHIHIHLPDGDTPKDGPSAGLAIFYALYSLLSQCALPVGLAVTGEITLRGRVMGVGGLKEKILAATRNDLRYMVLPKANLREARKFVEASNLQIHLLPVENLDEALNLLGRRQDGVIHLPGSDRFQLTPSGSI